jgi:thioredoxin-related protein
MHGLKTVGGVALGAFLVGCQPDPGLLEEAEGAGWERPPGKQVSVEWHQDFFAALQRAEDTNRPILIKFTGSDWSVRCARWREMILGTPEFTLYARENLVLVELDFPRNLPQTTEVVQQNQVLEALFEVEEFPTFILLDPEGEEILRVFGVLPEDPDRFISWLKEGRIDSA